MSRLYVHRQFRQPFHTSRTSIAMTSAAPASASATSASSLPPLTLERLVRPYNRWMMVLWALLAATFAGWLFWMSDTFLKLYHGPEPVTVSQLLAMKPDDAAGRFFDVTTTIKAAKLLETTTTTRRRRGGASTSVTNHFALIQGGAVLVETGKGQLENRFFAWSQPFTAANQYYERAVKQLGVWGAGRATKIPVASVLLKTSEGPESETTLYGSIVGAVTLGLLVLLYRFMSKLRNYLKSGAFDTLYTSVRAKEGIPALVAEIDQQLATRDPTEKPKGWELFPTWLMVFQRGGPQLMSMHDVMWVAPFLKGKQDIVRVVARDGKTIDLNVQADRVMPVLGAFHYRAPWAVIGPDANFEAHFNKTSGIFATIKRQFAAKPASKGELIRDCDARRVAILAEQAQMAQAAPTPATG
jgi:hypothetical protein